MGQENKKLKVSGGDELRAAIDNLDEVSARITRLMTARHAEAAESDRSALATTTPNAE